MSVYYGNFAHFSLLFDGLKYGADIGMGKMG